MTTATLNRSKPTSAYRDMGRFLSLLEVGLIQVLRAREGRQRLSLRKWMAESPHNRAAVEPPCSLRSVGEVLTLSEDEIWLTALALAPDYEPRIASLYGELAGRGRACGLNDTVLAAIEGCSHHQLKERYASVLVFRSRLQRLGLLEKRGDELVETHALQTLLFGRKTLPESFEGWAYHIVGCAQDIVLSDAARTQLEIAERAWTCNEPPPVTYLMGASGTGRTLVAHHLSRACGRNLIKVEADAFPQHLDALCLVREARVLDAALLIRFPGAIDRAWLRRIKEVVEHNVSVCISLPEGCSTPILAGRSSFRLVLERPAHAERRALWSLYLPDRTRAEGLDDDALAFRFRGTGRDIAELAAQALDLASYEASRPQRLTLEHLGRVAHQTVSEGLQTLGARCPAIPGGLSAVVLPREQRAQLEEVVTRVKHRQRVLEHWGFGRMGYGLGTTVLMSGPPGTGKTLSARAVATTLGIPLYRIDLSQVVSKWVGETEKQLGQLFDEAESSGAALLFDEADALFAKRSEVKGSNDRYANLEVGFLLQRIEAFTGLCFLTTNMVQSIDPAFVRRMSLHIQYALPELEERNALWWAALPPEAPLASTVDIEALATAFEEMSGAEIRNAALRAAFIAAEEERPMTHSMLYFASIRERAASGGLVQSPEFPGHWNDMPKTDSKRK